MRQYALICIPFKFLLTLGASLFSGRSGSFKSVLLALISVMLLSLVGLVLLYKLGSSLIFGVIFVILNGCATAVAGVGLEFLA